MNIEQHLAALDTDRKAVADGKLTLDALKHKYLSRQGVVKTLYQALKDLPESERRDAGQSINTLRDAVEACLADEPKELPSKAASTLDLSRQPYPIEQGSLHPVNLILNKVIDIFEGLGFDIIDDNEIDSEENCFDKLRIPAWHPARAMQDTFYLNDLDHTLLRTHSTATQPKILATRTPPFKIISIGKVFRSDELDATHTPMFHQVDGFMVGTDITFAHLKGVLEVFIREFLPNVKALRFRPHYFSYTEPSLELDLQCEMCSGKGCKACKNQGWIELLGAGMMHPDLFAMAGYPPEKYTGFAFGLGVERIVMQRYGITDIRTLYANDLRLLRQIIR